MSPAGPAPEFNSTCWNAIDPNATGIDIQIGCDNAACEAAVCDCDPYCCNNRWDLACRGYYHSSNYAAKDNTFTSGCSASILCCEDQVYSDESEKVVVEEVERTADLVPIFTKMKAMNPDSSASYLQSRYLYAGLLICIGFIAI